jgi:hypothetical protein
MDKVVYTDAHTCRLIFRARLGALIAFALAIAFASCLRRAGTAGAPAPSSEHRVCVRRS